jgi:hypothetical protein
MKKKQEKKKKCHILLISKVFLSGHPKKGQPTNFKQKIAKQTKLHTIRKNYKEWKRKIDEVNAGKAFISLREWEGRPRHSNQQEFKQLHAGQVGIQHCEILTKSVMKQIKILIDGESYPVPRVSVMDGLNPVDFYFWMNPKCQNLHMKNHCIIHFSPHKYDEKCKKL